MPLAINLGFERFSRSVRRATSAAGGAVIGERAGELLAEPADAPVTSATRPARSTCLRL